MRIFEHYSDIAKKKTNCGSEILHRKQLTVAMGEDQVHQSNVIHTHTHNQ